MTKPERQRLDKWLWYARFAKTRSLAAQLILDGHVRIDGRRAETASRAVTVGSVVTVAAAHATLVIRIVDLGHRRGPATEARGLYAELPAAREGSEPGPP